MRAADIVYLNVPIVKVDSEERLVYGVATAEEIDKANEVMDYDSAKKCFGDWPGNIREMHQPKAVGKAVEVNFDDTKKQVLVTAKISTGAEDTWQKVLDGTLSYYSVGGRGLRKVEKFGDKTVNRIFMDQLMELSLVDNGAVPSAKIEVMKFTSAEPSMSKREAFTKSIENYDVQQALGVLSLLSSLTASEMGEVFYGEAPDAVDSDQLQLLRAAAALMVAFLSSEWEEQFSDLPTGDGTSAAGTDPTTGGAPGEEAVKVAKRVFKPCDPKLGEAIEKIFDELPITFQMLDKTGQLWFSKDVRGKKHNDFIQKMHDMTSEMGAVCKSADDGDNDSEGDGEVDKVIDPATATVADVQAVAQSVEKAISAGTPGASSAPSPVSAGTPGAQGNPSPASISTAGGGAAAGGNTTQSVTPQSQAVPAPGEVKKDSEGAPNDGLEAILKSLHDLGETVNALKSDLEGAKAENATLKEELNVLKSSPRPGGPKARAVSADQAIPVMKTLGSQPSESGDVTNDEVQLAISVLENIAKNATSAEAREAATTEYIKIQQRFGINSQKVNFRI